MLRTWDLFGINNYSKLFTKTERTSFNFLHLQLTYYPLRLDSTHWCFRHFFSKPSLGQFLWKIALTPRFVNHFEVSPIHRALDLSVYSGPMFSYWTVFVSHWGDHLDVRQIGFRSDEAGPLAARRQAGFPPECEILLWEWRLQRTLATSLFASECLRKAEYIQQLINYGELRKKIQNSPVESYLSNQVKQWRKKETHAVGLNCEEFASLEKDAAAIRSSTLLLFLWSFSV